MKIVRMDIDGFHKYQDDIMDIYMEAGTNGVQEQYLDREKEKKTMEEEFKAGGYGYLVFLDNRVIGFMTTHPLHHDPFLPDSIKSKFPLDKCYYISEMDIHKDFRRQGIGGKLIKHCIDEVDRERWNYLFIRAWKKNLEAVRFYKRYGFIPGDMMEQEKIKKDRSGNFMIKKQYLWQKLY